MRSLKYFAFQKECENDNVFNCSWLNYPYAFIFFKLLIIFWFWGHTQCAQCLFLALCQGSVLVELRDCINDASGFTLLTIFLVLCFLFFDHTQFCCATPWDLTGRLNPGLLHAKHSAPLSSLSNPAIILFKY